MTEKALKAAIELGESEGMGNTIRVRVVGGGCAGFSYDMYFDDRINELDEVVQLDGIKLVVDPLSLQYLEDTEIDYIDGPFGSGFKFLNPNVTGSCGCGSSVSF